MRLLNLEGGGNLPCVKLTWLLRLVNAGRPVLRVAQSIEQDRQRKRKKCRAWSVSSAAKRSRPTKKRPEWNGLPGPLSWPTRLFRLKQ